MAGHRFRTADDLVNPHNIAKMNLRLVAEAVKDDHYPRWLN